MDPDQTGEAFDDELLADEYPPDEPLGADDEGVTELEELGGESFAERDERTEPEVWERPAGAEGQDPGVELVGDDAGVADDEADLVGERVGTEEGDEQGPLAPDDEFSGDETTRDVVTERVPPPAEDAAVHVDDEAPGATP
ncbi:MAG TPA: hypothetical protein VKD21_05940 [Acidimicrobiales bacterium]|nr:hypothetical protein [Acidimicrobiales bacterium]